MKKLILIIPAVVTIFTGCAYLSSDTVTPIYTVANGTNPPTLLYAKTHARAVTLFDANSSLTKFRNSNGGPTNTYTSGTMASGVNEQSSASNIVAILNAAAAIASKVP